MIHSRFRSEITLGISSLIRPGIPTWNSSGNLGIQLGVLPGISSEIYWASLGDSIWDSSGLPPRFFPIILSFRIFFFRDHGFPGIPLRILSKISALISRRVSKIYLTIYLDILMGILFGTFERLLQKCYSSFLLIYPSIPSPGIL